MRYHYIFCVGTMNFDVHFSFTVVALVSVMIAINPELGSKA